VISVRSQLLLECYFAVFSMDVEDEFGCSSTEVRTCQNCSKFETKMACLSSFLFFLLAFQLHIISMLLRRLIHILHVVLA
jgi:hypothetical protein